MPLQVQGSDKTKLEVHGSVRARFTLRIVTRLGERCIEVSLQSKDGDRGAQQCQNMAKGVTAGARQ